MSFGVLFVLGVVAGAAILLVTERFPIDQVAAAVPVVLLLGGVVTVEQALSGLSHPATVTVAAMLALGVGVSKTGGVAALARWIRRASLGGPRTRLLAVCLAVAAVSPFLNNTAVVVIFIPIFMAMASRSGEPASRYLMPLSYSAILGGTVTLIGTSTNLIVWGMAEARGFTELSLFAVTPLGVAYLAVGMAYLFTVGRGLLPSRETPPDLSTKYDVRSFATELHVTAGSPVVGAAIGDLDWGRQDLTVLDILREGRSIPAPGPERRIRADDLLLVQGDARRLISVAERLGLETPSHRIDEAEILDEEEGRLVEVLVGPGAPVVGTTLRDTDFHQRFGATVLAVQHHGEALHGRLARRVLEVGDILLVHGPASRLAELAEEQGFIPLGEVEESLASRPRAAVALAIMAAVVAAAGSGMVEILPAALTGAVAMIFTGCVSLRELYRELDWSVIVLLAGLMPLGVAMDTTGAARLLGQEMAGLLGGAGPVVAVAVFYVVTSLLTEVMSNNAAAVVLTPIALLTAAEVGMNPYALLVAVMFGASASFMTPLGYQTNALIYGPGGYRFTDFLRVGGPLNLILLGTAALLIPLIWPS